MKKNSTIHSPKHRPPQKFGNLKMCYLKIVFVVDYTIIELKVQLWNSLEPIEVF
jgi:hypothetical protein